MRELKYSLDNGGHGLIEMPCGTGKTITILSFLVAYKECLIKLGHVKTYIYLYIYIYRVIPKKYFSDFCQ